MGWDKDTDRSRSRLARVLFLCKENKWDYKLIPIMSVRGQGAHDKIFKNQRFCGFYWYTIYRLEYLPRYCECERVCVEQFQQNDYCDWMDEIVSYDFEHLPEDFQYHTYEVIEWED